MYLNKHFPDGSYMFSTKLFRFFLEVRILLPLNINYKFNMVELSAASFNQRFIKVQSNSLREKKKSI